MRSHIRTALRIAIYYKYTQLCIGTFGLGSGFRNPVEEVATMWREALLKDPEFVGYFRDVVLAFDPMEGVSASHGRSKAGSSKSGGSGVSADLEVFRNVFRPAAVIRSWVHACRQLCNTWAREQRRQESEVSIWEKILFGLWEGKLVRE